jgi:hypothetical protein
MAWDDCVSARRMRHRIVGSSYPVLVGISDTRRLRQGRCHLDRSRVLLMKDSPRPREGPPREDKCLRS